MKVYDKVAERLAAERKKARSAWMRGVYGSAIDLLDTLDSYTEGDEVEQLQIMRNSKEAEKFLLNGAKNWSEYSWGGSALVYNEDIAKAYCTPSELRRTQNGNKKPNAREEWLDVQARALWQAMRLLWSCWHKCILEVEQ